MSYRPQSAQEQQDEILSEALKRPVPKTPADQLPEDEDPKVGQLRLARMQHQNAQLLSKKPRKG